MNVNRPEVKRPEMKTPNADQFLTTFVQNKTMHKMLVGCSKTYGRIENLFGLLVFRSVVVNTGHTKHTKYPKATP